jgi:hypothetical protein
MDNRPFFGNSCKFWSQIMSKTPVFRYSLGTHSALFYLHVLPRGNTILPKRAQNAFTGLKNPFFGYLTALILTLPFSESI